MPNLLGANSDGNVRRIGNTSIDDNGNIMVKGFKLPTANKALGKVLRSDADGNADWADDQANQIISIDGMKIRLSGGGGEIDLPYAANSTQIPKNTVYVSPTFSNTAPYFSNIADAVNYIDSLPVEHYTIVVYAGIYTEAINITSAITLFAIGKVSITDDFLIANTQVFNCAGNIEFNKLTINEPTQFVNMNFNNASQIEITAVDLYGNIDCSFATQIDIMAGSPTIKARSIGTINSGGFSQQSPLIEAELIGKITIRDEATLTIRHANIGSAYENPVLIEAGCYLKLQDCKVTSDSNYDAINAEGGGFTLILDNVLLISGTNNSINFGPSNYINLFLRGHCTANKPIFGTYSNKNIVDSLIIEPDADIDSW